MRRSDPEVRRLVHQQGVVGHEEEAMTMDRSLLVVSSKLIALDGSDSFGATLKHNFVVPLQWLAELREVDNDDTSGHGSSNPPSTCPAQRWWLTKLLRSRNTAT